MASTFKSLFGSKETVPLTPEIEKMIEEAKFLIRQVKQQMRSKGIMGNLSYHGQLDDSIALLTKDIDQVEHGRGTPKHIEGLEAHMVALHTCAMNLLDHFEEEYSIQHSLREKYLKEKKAKDQAEERKKEAAYLASVREYERAQAGETAASIADVDPCWKAMFEEAEALLGKKEFSPSITGGQTAAALLSASGNIYTGISIDAPFALGTCAVRSAIFQMLAEGETTITHLLVLHADGRPGIPCGACKELIMQLMPDTFQDIAVMVNYAAGQIAQLGEL